MPETSGAPPERVPAGSRLSLKAILAGAAESIEISALGATSQASVSSATALTGPSMRISQEDLILLTSIEEGGCPNRGAVAAFHPSAAHRRTLLAGARCRQGAASRCCYRA